MASRARKLAKSVHSPEQDAFCSLMIAARKRANLTQQELAARLKKPQSFVAKYEGDERRLDVIEFLQVAAGIGAYPVRLIKKLVTADSKMSRRVQTKP